MPNSTCVSLPVTVAFFFVVLYWELLLLLCSLLPPTDELGFYITLTIHSKQLPLCIDAHFMFNLEHFQLPTLQLRQQVTFMLKTHGVTLY